MNDILLKYIHWYDFLNDLDTQSDFDKNFVAKKLVKYFAVCTLMVGRQKFVHYIRTVNTEK